MKKIKKVKKTLPIFSICLAVLALNTAHAYEDPYISGLKSYAADVASTLKKVGYIGKELALPQATKVADNVYTIVGSQIWHNPANFGLNNNITFIIFTDGVFVFNAGANPAIAYSVHKQIKRITDKPVKWLAVENNQGHAYLGASYWYDVGVKNMYSSVQANDIFDKAFSMEKKEWGEIVGKTITEPARNVTDKFTTFEGKMSVDVGGGETFELIDFGAGHTPASTSVYIPSKKLFLSGDLAFNERMPVMFNYTNSFDWMKSYENMMKQIPKDVIVIPGHGTPTDMATVKKQTYDYFRYLQVGIEKIANKDGTMADAENIDQSAYAHRPVFEQAAKNNARKIYIEITGGDI